MNALQTKSMNTNRRRAKYSGINCDGPKKTGDVIPRLSIFPKRHFPNTRLPK